MLTKNYRENVISRIPQLKALDDTVITRSDKLVAPDKQVSKSNKVLIMKSRYRLFI